MFASYLVAASAMAFAAISAAVLIYVASHLDPS